MSEEKQQKPILTMQSFKFKTIWNIVGNNIPLILIGMISLVSLGLQIFVITNNSEGNNIRALQQEIDEIKNTDQYINVQQQIKDIQQTKDDISKIFSFQRSELNDILKQIYEQKIDSDALQNQYLFQKQILEVQTKITNLENSFLDQYQLNESLQNQINENQTQNSLNNQDIAIANQNFDALQPIVINLESISETQQQINMQLKQEITDISTQTITNTQDLGTLQSSLQSANTNIVALLTQGINLSNDNKNQQLVNTSLQKQITDNLTQTQLNAKNIDALSSMFTNLETSSASLQYQITDISTQTQSNTQNIGQVFQKMVVAQNKITSLQNSLVTQQSMNTSFEQQITDISAQTLTNTRNVGSAFLNIDVIQTKIINLQNSYVAQQSMNASLQLQITDIFSKTSSNTKNIDSSNQSMGTLQTKVTTLEKKPPNKTINYGPYHSAGHWTTITSANLTNGYGIFPTTTFCQITLTQTSLLTFSFGGHIQSNFNLQPLFLVNQNPISSKDDGGQVYGTSFSYGTSNYQWQALNLVNQKIYLQGIQFHEYPTTCNINAGEFNVMVQQIDE